jgi:hypothetical protein
MLQASTVRNQNVISHLAMSYKSPVENYAYTKPVYLEMQCKSVNCMAITSPITKIKVPKVYVAYSDSR